MAQTTEIPHRYLRVTTTDGKAVILRVTEETDLFISGTEVNRDGDEVVPRGTDSEGRRYTERLHLIGKGLHPSSAADEVEPPLRHAGDRFQGERLMVPPTDYFGRPVQVGDVLRSVGWSSGGGFPLFCTDTDLTVRKVNRTRVVVTGPNFVGEVAVLASCARVMERDGQPFPLDLDAWHAGEDARVTA
jgi:hypothetical protein